MSHIVEQKAKYNNLEALRRAAQQVGCELVLPSECRIETWEDAQHGILSKIVGASGGEVRSGMQMKSYFNGRTANDCAAIIRVQPDLVKQQHGHAPYEIGVVPDVLHGGWKVKHDSHMGGYGLEDRVGKTVMGQDCRPITEAPWLLQAYTIENARMTAESHGYAVTQYKMADGRIILEAEKADEVQPVYA